VDINIDQVLKSGDFQSRQHRVKPITSASRKQPFYQTIESRRHRNADSQGNRNFVRLS
jgi:hypothetical protein